MISHVFSLPALNSLLVVKYDQSGVELQRSVSVEPRVTGAIRGQANHLCLVPPNANRSSDLLTDSRLIKATLCDIK